MEILGIPITVHSAESGSERTVKTDTDISKTGCPVHVQLSCEKISFSGKKSYQGTLQNTCIWELKYKLNFLIKNPPEILNY